MTEPAAPRPETREPIVRRPIGVLVSRFPLVTETFVLREIEELERQGQPVVLVPLLRERPEVVHPEARPWTERALYTPFLSPAIVAANLRALSRGPTTYLGTLLRLVWETLPSPGFLLRSLALFPKAVYLALNLSDRGVAHLHAHFATHPATVAWVASRLGSLTYSLTAHAHDLFVDATFLEDKLREARFVRTISQFNRHWLGTRFPDVATPVRVVPMGIPVAAYRGPIAEEPEAGAEAEGTPDVLCVAALKPYKGLPVLLEACDLMRRRGTDFRCLVVGEGPERRRLEGRIRALDLEGTVALLGAREQGEVARLMRAARVVVLPSLVAADGQMEGLPVVLMEAAAAARPIVASDLSGIPELVEDGVSGTLVPPGDAAALADALERMLAHPAEATRRGRQAWRRVASGFRLEDTAASLLRALDPENPPPDDSDLVARLLADEEALGIEVRRTGPDARIFQVLVSDGEAPRRVIVKQHRSQIGESAPPADRAFREATVLRRLEALRERGIPLGAPRVLRLDEASATLILEPVTGEPVDATLRRLRLSARPGESLERVGRLSGAWLRAFQDALDPPRGDEPLAAWFARLDRAVDRGERAATLRRRDRIRVRRLLERGRSLLATGAGVASHGDFWPGNVLLRGDTVRVLDFEGFGRRSPWEDAASFLVHAELYFPPPLGRRYLRLESGFLAGLGREPGPALAACRAAEAAQALALRRWRSGSPWLAPWRRHRLRRRLAGGAS